VYTSGEAKERADKVAELYNQLSGQKLVVCATNEECHELNASIRRSLIQCGKVKAGGFSTEVYLNKNVTGASRKEARHYEPGDVIQFSRSQHPSLKVKEWYTVVGRDLLTNRVTVKAPDGGKVTYNVAANFGVSEIAAVERREFAPGDRVQLLATERSAGLRSGTSGTVEAVEANGRLTLRTDGGILKRVDLARYKRLDYDYASTGHRAQSRTVDHVIAVQTSAHREEVINRASLYVAASRTRGELFLVLDDLAQASQALDRPYEKATALDLGKGPSAGHEQCLALSL
jgi:hypothetical protein